jgi:hypothetical protein
MTARGASAAMRGAAVALGAAVGLAALGACGTDRAAPPDPGMAPDDDDPLAVSATPAAGSLDDLHQRVIAKRCSGQPGLCHNGQFEPNLSTPAMTYAYLVGRPAIEKPDLLRVKAGDPVRSVLIDKLRNRGVATQMPLGAEPLAEADIAAIEAWITAGALRGPGAASAPVLNNPPRRPEIALFDGSGARLDGTGPVRVAVGTTVALRHSVQDFETPDPQIPFAAVVLSIADGRNVVIEPAANDPHVGRTTFDANGPMSRGDRLNYMRSWTIPETLPLITPAGRVRSEASAHGKVVSVFAVYLDGAQGVTAFDVSPFQIEIP